MAVTKVDTAEQFDTEYPRVRDWLLEALRYTRNSITEVDLLKSLYDRDYQLWTTENAACVTSITEWEGNSVCCLFLIGGNKGCAMREILHVGQPVIEAYARKHNCKGLFGIGRVFWGRVLPQHGFIVKGDQYFKEL
ncbi:hypothetical protein AB3G45_19585 [Shinella sp. S4-D37]|uniref:hypothetical protein n=1 Tax=Shinella sp. S4-D37 TaxID=3161999 RepID=UPI003465A74F